MTDVTLHGLKNCDTCRKAMKWLEENGIAVAFRDVRKQPLSAQDLATFMTNVGQDVLINRRGTTWRGLSDAERASADDDGAVELLVKHPALMKRPVIVGGDDIFVGFNAAVQQKLLALAD